METISYSDDERAKIASRIMSDARLISQGAEITVDGRLDVPQASIDMLDKEETDYKVKQFLETTPEGLQITANEAVLDDLYEITKPTDWMVLSDAASADMSIWEVRQKILGRAEEDGLGIDLINYDPDDTWQHSLMAHAIQGMRERLENTASALIQNPAIRLGNSVNVPRNAKGRWPAYVEPGWIVKRILVNGKILVDSPDHSMFKRIDVDTLAELNPPLPEL